MTEPPNGHAVFTLVLLESELELMPEAIQDDPRVRQRAAERDVEPSMMVLDAAEDEDAIRGLPDAARRGRPDITHAFLLMTMDSPLNAAGKLRVFVHTRGNDVIHVQPGLRCPPHHHTFIKHMEALYRGASHVGPYRLERGVDAAKLLEAHAKGPRLLLDEQGEPADLGTFQALEAPATLCLGGFPEGRLRRTPVGLFDARLSLQQEQLAVWSVLVPVLAGLGAPKG